MDWGRRELGFRMMQRFTVLMVSLLGVSSSKHLSCEMVAVALIRQGDLFPCSICG